MQYTGLKDKSGKDIYEGDILDEKWKWEVIYFADGFIGKHETPRNSMPLHTLLRKREKAGFHSAEPKSVVSSGSISH